MNRGIKFRAWDKKYEIGSDGSVWSLDYNHTGKRRQLREYLDEDGYRYVFLNIDGIRYKRYPHRMVAKLFLRRPSVKHQVNHQDSNRQNNDVSNLEWVTSRENTLHGWANGRKVSDKQRHAASEAMKKANHIRWHGGQSYEAA